MESPGIRWGRTLFLRAQSFLPARDFVNLPNNDFYQHSQDRYANKGFLTRGIYSRWFQDLKAITSSTKAGFY